jgi:hypothetical protein
VIPDLVDGSLPPGEHVATWREIVAAFGTNPRRQALLAGLRELALTLAAAGCQTIWIDGSFVTDKERPGDYDACWDWVGVDLALVDPLLVNYPMTRASAKGKYGGDIFIAGIRERGSGLTFVEFFQRNRDGQPKGIVRFDPGEVQ